MTLEQCLWMPVAMCSVLSWRQMGNMEVEEVIERHVATLLMQDQVRGLQGVVLKNSKKI